MTCRFCGIQSQAVSRSTGRCKSRVRCMERELEKLKVEVRILKPLRSIGDEMSNLCFNLGQRSGNAILEKRHCEIMRDLQRRWDDAKRPA